MFSRGDQKVSSISRLKTFMYRGNLERHDEVEIPSIIDRHEESSCFEVQDDKFVHLCNHELKMREHYTNGDGTVTNIKKAHPAEFLLSSARCNGSTTTYRLCICRQLPEKFPF